MAWCMSCSNDVAPIVAMNGAAQIVQSCPTCESPIGGKAMTQPMAGFDARTERPMPVGVPRAAPEAASVVVPFPGKARHAAAAESMPTTPGDVIAMIRARLAFLDAEIAKRAGMELEAKRLRKMIAAADRVQEPSE